MKLKILVTGAAGFIGFHTCQYLLNRGEEVIGIDNLNDYYEVSLKESRLELLKKNTRFKFLKIDISDKEAIERLFKEYDFENVVHLAAQAGVRYSLENPHAYMESNIIGFLNILEGVRHHEIGHLVYASSSSVYGANTLQPFSEHHNVDHPVSLYAASKKSNELMAHSYSHLYGIKTTGLRFFTVYGPWGRPDMAYFKFVKSIFNGESIDVYNNGEMERDFSYIDDIVEGVVRAMDNPPCGSAEWKSDAPDPATSYAKYRIFNIGNNNSVKLMDFIEAIEKAVGKKAEKNFLPMQPGDVLSTFADCSELDKEVSFRPSTPVQEGINMFVEWYRVHYNS